MDADRTLVVDEADAGQRLDRFVAGSVGSRAQAQRLIEEGRVLVDGVTRPKRHPVARGEVVTVRVAVGESGKLGDSAAVPYGVAYEDEHLLVVDKPAGVVVHPARGHRSGTLAQALAGRAAGGEEEWRAGIVHRLDRDTSGLLVVARGEEVHRALKRLLAARELRREYLALVAGRPDARTGVVDAPIGRHPRDRVLMAVGGGLARAARTHFEIELALPRSTLLRVSLETGRTHQIRVHLAAIGLPVCGDPQYGVPGAYGLRRQFLHATRLAFPHPVAGAMVDVTSPLPEDLAAALARASAEA
jgi:23S rRNA pseudouridine1911/1915/1917 synthase